MPSIAQLARWELEAFLLALFAIVIGQLLAGQISTHNLLYGRKNDVGTPTLNENGAVLSRKPDDSLYFSPERVQLLMLTLGAAFYYLTQVLNNAHPGQFPPLPSSWTETVGGSNALYLGGKALSRFWPRDRDADGNPK